MRLFAGYIAQRMVLIFADFARGGGDVIVGMRIPVFDGPTLSAIVFTAVFALCLSDAPGSRGGALIWSIWSAAAYVLVLLCFRRTFWTQLGVATLLLLMLKTRRRVRKLMLATLAVVIVATALGPAFYERMQSMDFTQDESEFSQGNPDHVGEILDAWEQLKQDPVLGIGLGTSFQTVRIQGWKEESVMVHNAPLHVWLKYGLLGLVCYLWFHAALLRWLWRKCRQGGSGAKVRFMPPPIGTAKAVPFRRLIDTDEAVPFQRNTTTAFTAAAFCYLTAQFVASLVLAVAMRGAGPCNTPRYR